MNKLGNPNFTIEKHYLPNMKMDHLSTSNNDNWNITKYGKLMYKGIKDPNSEK